MRRQRTKQTARSLGSSIPSDGLDRRDEPHPSDHVASSGTLSQAKLAGRPEISEPRGKARAAGAGRSDGRKMLRVGPGSLPTLPTPFSGRSRRRGTRWRRRRGPPPTRPRRPHCPPRGL
ncbi:unnamed protein product [Musa hybrid cultivar]